MDVVTEKILSTPWAAALIDDPNWTFAPTPARDPKPWGEDSFFAETIKTDRTIRSWLAYRPVKAVEGPVPYRELRVILDLGDKLNSHTDIAHGGIAAALLDETCGAIAMLNRAKRMEQLEGLGQPFDEWHYFTACTFAMAGPNPRSTS